MPPRDRFWKEAYTEKALNHLGAGILNLDILPTTINKIRLQGSICRVDFSHLEPGWSYGERIMTIPEASKMATNIKHRLDIERSAEDTRLKPYLPQH